MSPRFWHHSEATALRLPGPVGASDALWRGNEPAGMSALTDRPFNAVNELSWFDSFDTANPPPAGGGYMEFISDSSAPHSPSGIIHAVFPTGYVGGGGPGAADPPSFTNTRTLYVCAWMRYSANWQGHSSGVNKLMYFHTAQGDNGVFYFSATGIGNADLIPQPRFQGVFDDDAGGFLNFSPNLIPSATVPRGSWFLVEIAVVGNTAGVKDGTIDVYLNGAHTHNRTVQWQSGVTTWGRFSYYNGWGGTGDSAIADMTLDWDHCYISGKAT